jgi:hypothetical protein
LSVPDLPPIPSLRSLLPPQPILQSFVFTFDELSLYTGSPKCPASCGSGGGSATYGAGAGAESKLTSYSRELWVRPHRLYDVDLMKRSLISLGAVRRMRALSR